MPSATYSPPLNQLRKSLNPPHERNPLGELLKSYRSKHKLAQIDLADKLHCSQQYLSRMEKGEVSLRLPQIVKILNQLGLAENLVADLLARHLQSEIDRFAGPGRFRFNCQAL